MFVRMPSLVVLPLLVFGCDKSSKTDPSPPAHTTPASSSVAAPSAPAPLPPFVNEAGKPGAAYLFTEAAVVRVEDGKVEEIVHNALGKSVVLTSSGDVVTDYGEAVDRRGHTTTIAPNTTATGVAAAADGKVYFASQFSPMSMVVPGKEKQDLSPAPPEPLRDVAVTTDGTVFGATSEKLYRLQEASWNEVDLKSFGSNPHVVDLVRGASETLFVITTKGAAVLASSGELKPITKIGYAHGGSLLSPKSWASTDGTLVYRNDEDVIIARSGAEAVRLPLAKLKAGDKTVQRIDALGIDARRRVWIGTDRGLLVTDDKGKVLQAWPMGALPGRLTAVALVGDGPDLPAAPPKATLGKVSGRLLNGGQPAGGVPVEMCLAGSAFVEPGSTPCSTYNVRFHATTDAAGRFTFSGVPPRRYNLAYKVGDAWRTTMGLGEKCCTRLSAAPHVELDDIEVRR